MTERLRLVYGDDVERVHVFTGTLVKVQHLGRHAGTAVVTHFDSRWAMIVDVAADSPADKVIEPGKRIVFAIHSPTHVGAMVGAAEGGSYTFAVLKGDRGRRDCLRAVETIRRAPVRALGEQQAGALDEALQRRAGQDERHVATVDQMDAAHVTRLLRASGIACRIQAGDDLGSHKVYVSRTHAAQAYRVLKADLDKATSVTTQQLEASGPDDHRVYMFLELFGPSVP